MARFFLGIRERNFIADINKELIKDINGQMIRYYSISELKTRVHELYNESVEKVFDNPIEIAALVSNPENTSKINVFGPEESFKVEVYIQYRDLVDNNIKVQIGDFFSYGENFYEIMSANWIKNIYGHAEEKDGIKLIGNKARESQFKAKIIGPTDIRYNDTDAIQTEFTQSKGLFPGDKRDLVDNNVLEKASYATEISKRGDDFGAGSSFYNEIDIVLSGS